jgi:ATP-binding cassette subfamily F protein 3
MSLVSTENLGLAFGAETILEGCRLQVSAGDRIGLVGQNGSGKTSLLRMIAKLERPSTGNISQARTTRIAYVGQRPQLDGAHTVYQEVSEPFATLRALEDEVMLAGEALAEGGADLEAASARYEELSKRFEHEGGYIYEAEIRRTLQGLGVPLDHWQRATATLSGGEQARVAIAKALLERPDLLLLDEPTNHLDLTGLAWIENLLSSWSGAFILVSHDRFFLDQVVRDVWEVANRRITAYKGNYSSYARQRTERLRRQRDLFESQQEQISKQEQLIRRYGAGQRAKWAKGLEKRLDRLERLEAPQEVAALKLNLGRSARGGRVALTLDQVTVHRPGTDQQLLRLPTQLEVARDARIGIVGPNGCGKTTLLRTITGELQPGQGRAVLGHATMPAFHRQGMEDLNDERTVFDELLSGCELSPQEARDLLARFLFRGDDVQKKVGVLSGGERSRLALAKLAVAGANLLLLDEPTNHLDIAAREALESVLLAYAGAVLFVSHDRRFIDAIATELWSVEDGVLRPTQGNFSANLASRNAPPPKNEPERPRSSTKPRPIRHNAAIAQFELSAAELDTRLQHLRADLDAASTAQDSLEVARLGRLYVESQEELDAILLAWDEATTATNVG